MKNYKLCYVTGGLIVELIATTSEERIKNFIESIEEVEFENYYTQRYSYADSKKEPLEMPIIKNSEEIVAEFKKIFSQSVIDLGRFWDLVIDGSNLSNVKLAEVIKEFLNIFEYKVYFSYDQREFGAFSRAMMLVGIKSELDEFYKLSRTFPKNTKVIRLFYGDQLINKESAKEKNKVYKYIIDKEKNK